jgi:hypothetical protein
MGPAHGRPRRSRDCLRHLHGDFIANVQVGIAVEEIVCVRLATLTVRGLRRRIQNLMNT